MGEVEVSQGLYQHIVGLTPAEDRVCGPRCPAKDVSFVDAVRFANALSAYEGLGLCYEIEGDHVSWPDGLACEGYRLPTEAEWEIAARAGEDYDYAGSDDVDEVGWHEGTAGDLPLPVGTKQPNRPGIYDMSGNVAEWVWDWDAPLTGDPLTDPAGPPAGRRRVVRGGSVGHPPDALRVTSREAAAPGMRTDILGFRLVRTAIQGSALPPVEKPHSDERGER
ncbi:MAG: formylglycine-generating enzyme family protein [Deltaproteobacteria bacterium]|nr:MAG: formylglycine-generating enzyme family protein [Deltaproteobacteria bacterium]